MTATSAPPAADLDLFSDGTLDVRRAAEFTSVGRTEIYLAMSRGELPYVTHGSKRLIPRKAIVAWLAAKLVARPAEPVPA